MNDNKPTILIVEDSQSYQQMYARDLGEHANILAAFRVADARQIFEANKGSIALVVMDACVPGSSPTTYDLTAEIRKEFTGPMIAASSVDDYRWQLMLKGCTHQANKRDVSGLVKRLLTEQRAQKTASESATPPSTGVKDVTVTQAIEPQGERKLA